MQKGSETLVLLLILIMVRGFVIPLLEVFLPSLVFPVDNWFSVLTFSFLFLSLCVSFSLFLPYPFFQENQPWQIDY